MKTNEKAPEGTAIPVTGASEINQVQYEPDYGNCQYPVDPVISELIELTRRANELYETAGALHIGCGGDPKIQMDEAKFFDLFSFGSCDEERHPEYDEYSATVQGIRFFCLVEKGGGLDA